ncbi:MAG: Hsp20/alpha crystallin family protein [Thermomicrobiales bacterium]
MIVIRRAEPRGRVRRSTETDELFRALVFGGNTMGATSRGVWRPSTEVYETETTLEIVAELAGMDREKIEVVIEGDIISIQGVRPDPAVCDHRSYHEARIPYGPFAADIGVPFAVHADAASANYESGFLQISIPREIARKLVPRQHNGHKSTEVQG